MKTHTLATLISALIFTTVIPVSPASAYSYEEMRNMTQSSYDLIKLSAARDLGLTGKDQVVVFIDDGIEIDHPYIKNSVLDGFCSSAIACGSLHLKSSKEAGGIFPMTSSSAHGNMVAGIIAGEVNAVALGGIAPGARLISITNTDGNFPGLEAAFNWILEAKKRYNIVAVSGSFGSVNLGTRSDFLSCSDSELNEKIKALSDAGIVPVFAAGNDSNVLKVTHPACLPFVVSVGALNYQGLLQSYSNIGGSLTVLAPSDVMTASRNGGYMLGGGTSAAAPVVAGVVALLKQAKPSATFQEIKSALQSSDKYLNDAYWTGLPVLNISSALSALKTGEFIKPPVIAQSDQEKRIGDFRKDAEEARKAQVNAQDELEIAKAALLRAEADAKLARDAQTKSEADAKLARDAQTKSEADAKLARDAQTKSESDLKAAQLGLKQIQQETAKLKSEFDAIRIQFNDLTSSSNLLQKENASLKKKLSAICKVKSKPKGC